jgi:hypothetical protein
MGRSTRDKYMVRQVLYWSDTVTPPTFTLNPAKLHIYNQSYKSKVVTYNLSCTNKTTQSTTNATYNQFYNYTSIHKESYTIYLHMLSLIIVLSRLLPSNSRCTMDNKVTQQRPSFLVANPTVASPCTQLPLTDAHSYTLSMFFSLHG